MYIKKLRVNAYFKKYFFYMSNFQKYFALNCDYLTLRHYLWNVSLLLLKSKVS